MDQLEITSSFTNETWIGEVDLDGADDWAKLNSAFILFNRTKDADVKELNEMGFTQPSLSAGDRVVLNGTPYKCEPIGWSPDERDPHQPLNPWPLG